MPIQLFKFSHDQLHRIEKFSFCITLLENSKSGQLVQAKVTCRENSCAMQQAKRY